jgi:hypothetical protein
MKYQFFFSFLIIHLLSNSIFSQCIQGDCLNGIGKYQYANGGVYEGSFKNGLENGQGKLIFSSGARYEGEFYNGKKNGKGVYYYTNGEVQDGDFVNGEFRYGTIKLPSGDKYIGAVSNGLFNGKGTYIWSDGDKYEGDFVNGKFHGSGKKTLANGSVIEGTWANGNLTQKKEEINSNTLTNNQSTPNFIPLEWEHAKGGFIQTTNKSSNNLTIWNEDNGRFVYEETAKRGQEVILKDLNRQGVFVKLTSTECFYKDNANPNWMIIYYGKWKVNQNNTSNQTANNSSTTNTNNTNNTTNSNNTNTSQGQSTQCNFVFKKPQLNITYVDNRKMCCYCNKRYAQYSTRNGASTEAIAYIGEELYLHFQKTNADKTHQDADIQRFQKFVAENYDLLSSMGVAFAVSRAQILEMTGNALCSKNRKVDKYSVDSKFCSAECQDKCSWSENCKCR